MTRARVLAAFAILCVAQVAVPLSMVWQHEQTLRTGRPFKVRTEPVDPVDALRGRYVAVSPVVHAPLPPAGEEPPVGDVWVDLEEGPDGFARARMVTTTRFDTPTALPGYVIASRPDDAPSIRVLLPLDRYYMEETKAPAVEREYRERAAAAQAWVTIRVRDGMAVIDGLYLDGRRVEDIRSDPPA